jgi:hypothetical protein
VSSLPLVAKAALAALLMFSMGRAFMGPPAVEPRRAVARTLLAITALCYFAGASLAALGDAIVPGALVVIAGIETACAAAWLVRGLPDSPGNDDDDEDDGDDGGGPGGDGGLPPVDWDAFDRARRAWDRPRVG